MFKNINFIRLILWMEKIKGSFWFWPGLSLLFSVILSIVTLHLDKYLGDSLKELVPWIYGNQASGARSLLSTIAGSIMTVTGVTLSLTMLIVSHAATQHSPRLLENFMKQRVIQLALSTLVLTFTYCLLILRYVQEEIASSQTKAYVPHFSIFIALILTAVSLGVLFLFFNQVPENIKISNILNECGSHLIKKIKEQGLRISQSHIEANEFSSVILDIKNHRKKKSLYGSQSGFIQSIDYECLINLAEEHDLYIELKVRVGDFSHLGVLHAEIYYITEAELKNFENKYFSHLIIGRSRTNTQDKLFLADQLVEIIAKALSPGINDPRTANTAMDWLESACIEYANVNFPANLRLNKKGNPSLSTPKIDYEYITFYIYDQVIPYAATDALAAIHLMKKFKNSHLYLKNREINFYKILASDLERQSIENKLTTSTLEKISLIKQEIL